MTFKRGKIALSRKYKVDTRGCKSNFSHISDQFESDESETSINCSVVSAKLMKEIIGNSELKKLVLSDLSLMNGSICNKRM